MSGYASFNQIPVRLEVQRLVDSRYSDGKKPLSWDERREGLDVIQTVDGSLVKLFSDGGQTPPQSGWVIMLTDGNADQGYVWTLYGMPQNAALP